VGKIGESIAASYLVRHGHIVVERNYRKKWGEIDIVSRETNKIHFVEVKSVSYETRQALDSAVTRSTWRPEENVHSGKLRKLNRAIESWIEENRYQGDWQIDVVAVRMVSCEKYATVKLIPNVISSICK
jgi:putative endonuclease